MKSILCALATTLAASFATASGNEIAFDIRVTKGETLVTTASTSAVEGDMAPIRIERETSYVAQAYREGAEVVLVPGVITTGFSANLSPTVTSEGQIKARVTMSFVTLNAMENARNDEGLAIERPQTEKWDLDRQFTFDASGAPQDTSMGDYTIQIAARKL